MSLKAAFYSLGCKVNSYEIQALKGIFRQESFTLVDFKDAADVYVINTCTVTHLAARKSRQAARRAKRRNPQAFVVLMGCYPQADPEAVFSLSMADLFVGTNQKLELPRLVKEALAGKLETGSFISSNKENLDFEELPWMPEQSRTRAFLKIQEGCSQYCSYCIVPFARGPLRSLPLSRAIYYINKIAESGYKEVVLTGIRLGAYGLDLEPSINLAFLLQKAVTIEGIERIRLSSIEPQDFTDELVEIVSDSEKICPHFHIPLQSGDDTILNKMGRSYNTSFYLHLLEKLSSRKKDIAVSTDIIVGFPGEREEHFNRSYNFAKKCSFSRLHVFKYSARPYTRAAEMPDHVDAQTKEERSKKMMNLGEELSEKFCLKFLERRLPVLFERKITKEDVRLLQGTEDEVREEGQIWEGLAPNYLNVCAVSKENLRGQIREIYIEDCKKGFLLGR